MNELEAAFATWAYTPNDYEHRHEKEDSWTEYCSIRDRGLPRATDGKPYYFIPGEKRILPGEKLKNIVLYSVKRLQ